MLLQESNRQSCHHDADHRHQFDEDVERRTGSVFEWVAHGVANDGGLVVLAAFAAEVSFLNHLLGIVPCSARIRHEHGEGETGCQSAGQQSEHTGNS